MRASARSIVRERRRGARRQHELGGLVASRCPSSALKIENVGGDGLADLPLRAAADGLERPHGAGDDRGDVGGVARAEPRAFGIGSSWR